MKKKLVKKRSPKKHTLQSFIYIRYISVAVVAVALVLTGKVLFSATSRVHVLGAQTGPVLLADHGGDDSGGEGSSSGSSGREGSSGGSQPSAPNTAQVDCVGPDGQHFTTTFQACSDLNNAWHHSNFSFTPLNTAEQLTGQENDVQPTAQPTGTETENEAPKQEIEQKNPNKGQSSALKVKSEDGKTRIDLVENGVKVRIEQEGDIVKVKAEKPDGTEVELDTKDALDAINNELESEGAEIATTDANTVAIKKGSVEAQTELPISVDPTTHELTVTTPGGTKTVTILPDQAVNNLLENKLLTSIASQTSSTSGTTQNVTLTVVNNEPSFAIQGVLQKRILGIIPVGFAKTEFVSAQTGKVIKTDETLLNRIIEALSF